MHFRRQAATATLPPSGEATQPQANPVVQGDVRTVRRLEGSTRASRDRPRLSTIAVSRDVAGRGERNGNLRPPVLAPYAVSPTAPATAHATRATPKRLMPKVKHGSPHAGENRPVCGYLPLESISSIR